MTGGSVSPAEVRSVLRLVLRAVDRHLTPASGSQLWRKEVLTRFRSGAGTSPRPVPPTTVSTSTDAQPGPSGRGGSSDGVDRATLPLAPAGHAPSPAQALAAAREWAELANNIARHKELLRSYNIGLDVDERTKRMVEATARRVGFALPQGTEDIQSEQQQQQQEAAARRAAAVGKAAAAREDEEAGAGGGGRGARR
ncbi:hypothetical protein HYH02_000174 [Chlamydomonas schloesseri]|uniref:Uncharacterized protein n=1 Tax=Chlamydomonas schloesseri TaxID=2026947 RepID=A0A835WM83_9CHLO|nr:hypothetical protein HYH02_000174 [Chlamydomonas schloesseri]|eukprot:KAG2450070.1 hypothetical protein HYH02_000174 [Chlamydomonas schloesseri]